MVNTTNGDFIQKKNNRKYALNLLIFYKIIAEKSGF